MKVQETANDFLEKEKLGKLMQKFAIPCIISLLVGALYNIVDQIYIANADYLGSYGNAANTVVFPLTVVALAIAVMIGDGCCAFVSISLGAKENDKANRSVGNAIVFTVVSSLALTAVYLIFMEPILVLFGGTVNAETFAYAKEYFFYIAIGIPFYMFGQAMNPIIRSDGSPKFAMVSTLAGAVINIILDPIFIFVFKWGMMGAAVATVIGQAATALLAVWYLFRTKAVKIQRASFKLNGKLMGKFLPLGICSFLSQISLVAAMAAINNMIQKYGALDPIFGYNVGARRFDRAKRLFTRLLVAEACVGAVATLIVEIFPQQLLSVFGAANESVYYTDFGIKAFRIYLCMMIFACINKAAFIFLQSLGKPWTSTALSMLREVIFGVGFALLFPVIWGLDGVLYSMPVSDILTFVVSVIVIAHTYRMLNRNIASGQIKPNAVAANAV